MGEEGGGGNRLLKDELGLWLVIWLLHVGWLFALFVLARQGMLLHTALGEEHRRCSIGRLNGRGPIWSQST